MHFPKLSSLLALFLLSATAWCQERFTADDLQFFQEKAATYQQWLDKTGLGQALHVTKVRLEKEDTELELLLHIDATDLDTAIALWNRVSDDFGLANDQSLEEKLFNVFTSFMEIPPAQGNVQVYVLDRDGIYIPCFYVFVWEEQGNIRTESKMRECRDKPIDIKLKPLPLRQTVKGKNSELTKQRTADEVFNGILKFLRSKYGSSKCENRNPEIDEELRTETTLRVSVSDLCRVVLTDEDRSYWCRGVSLLGWNCNDVRRERLEFEFTYLPGSSQLSGRLTGKFGSGVYKPRKSGYMDMEPDFNDYLDTFHRKFQRELKAYLDKQ